MCLGRPRCEWRFERIGPGGACEPDEQGVRMAVLAGFPDDTYEAMEIIGENGSSVSIAFSLPLRSCGRQRAMRVSVSVSSTSPMSARVCHSWRKFRRQLSGGSAYDYQLAAELLYAQMFFSTQISAETKIAACDRGPELASGTRPRGDTRMGEAGAEQGIGGDMAFRFIGPNQLAWLNEFLIGWVQRPDTERLPRYWQTRGHSPGRQVGRVQDLSGPTNRCARPGSTWSSNEFENISSNRQEADTGSVR